jgi:SulP family sulfate permease
MSASGKFLQHLPPWLRAYRQPQLPQDLLAGAIVAVMLVPQGLAYAVVAGLPPVYGLYASVLPLLAYALFGSSMTLAVGPVAVSSLMTAAALTPLAAPGSAAYILGAAQLALLSGLLLFGFGLLRLGFLAKLLSNPVISGFTSGASLLILIGQLGPLLGIDSGGATALAQLGGLLADGAALRPATAGIGVSALVVLLVARRGLAPLARRLGASANVAAILPKLVPLVVVLAAAALTGALDWQARHAVAVVGAVPAGLPSLRLPLPAAEQFRALLFPAFTIGLVNFVSSVSMAQALALRRRQRIDADAELRGLGAANIASALAGAFPVSGGFSRSLVSFNAGAQTPLAGVIAALLMAVVLAGSTELFAALPTAVLAATIIVAVGPVIDFAALRRAWRYDRADAMALLGTAVGVVALGVEAGIITGVGLSLATLVWRSSHPHIAVLGRVSGTEHFRNIERYQVETLPNLVALRIDENLLFANAQAVDERVRAEVAGHPAARHLLLVMSSVSQIDTTAMETLLELNGYLQGRGVQLHLSEVKGPVFDRLRESPLIARLSGRVFMTTYAAFKALDGVEPLEYNI